MATVYFEDLIEGQEFVGGEVMVDKDEMLEYARKNDPWPFHVDEEAAQASSFGGLIASGGYAISLYYRLGHLLHNTADSTWAFLGGFDWHVSFPRPIRPGDRLHRKTVVRSKRLSSKPGRGIVESVGTLLNQNGEEVLRIEVASLIATRPAT
jgi:acyl dehydratase